MSSDLLFDSCEKDFQVCLNQLESMIANPEKYNLNSKWTTNVL